MPDVQAGISWFVSVLNGVDITAGEYESRFGEEFRAQVPFDTAFQSVLAQFRPLAPYKIVDTDSAGTRGEATIEASDGTRLRIVAEVDQDGVITTLFIQPTEQPELNDPPGSVAEAFERLAEIGQLRAIAAEVTGDACVPIANRVENEAAPLGSVFKLYVLAALGDSIAAGDIAWTDPVTIREELKSIPTGTLQDRAAGDVVTVREAAELMISISDNTAADHLIDLLGRETIERSQTEHGNSSAQLNLPFLDTREFAALKIGPASDLRDPQWIEGDEQTRRSILDQLAEISADDLPVAEWVTPVDPDRVEWFATPADLCRLALSLIDLTEEVPEIGEILEINPGIPAAEGTWDRVWFKGGSEPGLAAVWWVTEAGGRVFVTAGSVVDPDVAFDTTEAILLFGAVRDLLLP